MKYSTESLSNRNKVVYQFVIPRVLQPIYHCVRFGNWHYITPGGYLTRGVSDKGVSGWWGCLSRGVCPEVGVSATVHAGIHPLWTEFLTHACENITFPQLCLQMVKWVGHCSNCIGLGIGVGHFGFSQTHKIGNIGIIANFVFPKICSFLLYSNYMMLVNVKLDISGS